jgi:hypothetical protein
MLGLRHTANGAIRLPSRGSNGYRPRIAARAAAEMTLPTLVGGTTHIQAVHGWIVSNITSPLLLCSPPWDLGMSQNAESVLSPTHCRWTHSRRHWQGSHCLCSSLLCWHSWGLRVVQACCLGRHFQVKSLAGEELSTCSSSKEGDLCSGAASILCVSFSAQLQNADTWDLLCHF